MTVDREQHRGALSRALGERFVESCLGYAEATIECGLAARDHQSAAECVAPIVEE